MAKFLTVFSPVAGVVVPLETVPDPVFSERMLGDGLALDPTEETIYAPFDGKITNFNKAGHALVVSSGEVEALIHVGLETVSLKGEGFTPLASEGDLVKKGQPLLKFSQKIILEKAASSLVMLVITAPAEISLAHKAEGILKKEDALFDVIPATFCQAAPTETTFTESAPITVQNPNGLHARPAAVLARMAQAYEHAVELYKNGQTADAKSVLGIMGMALALGDKITLRVGGTEAEARALISQLENGFKNAFGETEAPAVHSPENHAPVTARVDFSGPVTLQGLCASAGLSQGKAFLYEEKPLTFDEKGKGKEAETALFEKALSTLIAEKKAQLNDEPNAQTREILSAHVALLQDPALSKTAITFIEQGKSAAFGASQAFTQNINVLKQTNDPFLMERVADLKDLQRTVLLCLNGTPARTVSVPPDAILVAQELLPSEAAQLTQVAGVLLAEGSPTTHASIILRNKNIPAVVGVGKSILSMPEGSFLCLDGTQATVQINPTQADRQHFEQRFQQAHAQQQADQAHATETCVTLDGVSILVEGNASNTQEAASCAQNGADGLGLVRTEFLFTGRDTAPTQAEQTQTYQAILEVSKGKVTFRTLDAGGDKPLPFVQIPPEENPILGIRGIRILAQNEAFCRTQIRALLSVRPLERVRIMLPMVTNANEVAQFRQLIDEEKANLGIHIPVSVGIMVEVPSAALLSEQLAAQADFFSLGTNDLTQYTLAIDRGHKTLSKQADALHPAVLKLISLTCAGAQKHGRPVGVCGALAGDLTAIPFLLGCGVTELAVPAGLIAPVKELIRHLDTHKCAALAVQAQAKSSAHEVRDLATKNV